MSKAWIALGATTLLAGAATLAFPYAMVTPGPLGDGHAALEGACFACHAPLRGAPRARCTACHDVERLGLATVAGAPRATANTKAHRLHRVVAAAECAGCHAGHRGWGRAAAEARFVHALLPAAARADCAGCHGADRPADPLHAPLQADCGGCHGTDAWKPARFDHDRWFRFDRNHPARCADCHTVAGDYKRYSCTGCHEHALPKMVREHRKVPAADLEACARCHRSGNEHDLVGGGREGGGGRRGKDDGDD